MLTFRATLLLALAALSCVRVGAVLPPAAGADVNVNRIAPGQYAHCVGSLTDTGNPGTATVSVPYEGTAALLEYSMSIAYDEYNQMLWMGTFTYMYKIDPKTCTLQKQLGQSYQGNADGDSTTALFEWITAFAPLPSRKVVVGDYNCRLRLYDPASNTVAALRGPGGDLGASSIAGCAAGLVPGANSVRPNSNSSKSY
eukprot:tig00000269_g23701.t1